MQSQGDRIRAERESLGLTQAELAKQVTRLFGKKIKQQSINHIETGKTTHPLFFSELCQALGVSPMYIRTGEIGQGSDATPMFNRENVSHSASSTFDVPLVSWVKAGEADFAVGVMEAGDAEEWLPCNRKHSIETFALRVEGHSMTAPVGSRYSFPEGINIFVDPELRGGVEPGDFVLAKINGHNAVTFKQLAKEDGRLFLRPLNTSYPLILDEFRILGKVVYAGFSL